LICAADPPSGFAGKILRWKTTYVIEDVFFLPSSDWNIFYTFVLIHG